MGGSGLFQVILPVDKQQSALLPAHESPHGQGGDLLSQNDLLQPLQQEFEDPDPETYVTKRFILSCTYLCRFVVIEKEDALFYHRVGG